MDKFRLYKGAWIFSGAAHDEYKLQYNNVLQLLMGGGGDGS